MVGEELERDRAEERGQEVRGGGHRQHVGRVAGHLGIAFMTHGDDPTAPRPRLLDVGQHPVVAGIPRDQSYDRMLGNIEEVRARGGRVIAVCHEGDAEVARHASHVLPVPAAADLLTPILSTIPLQLLAYHLATLRGHDVDQPRNLAKSVTVE